jgi:hypothetical protein
MKITHRNLLVFVLDEYPEKHDSADSSAKEKLIVASDDNFRDIVSFSTGFYERHSVQQQGPFEPPSLHCRTSSEIYCTGGEISVAP